MVTNTIIHKLTELFTKTIAIRYFYRYLKSPVYGLDVADLIAELLLLFEEIKFRKKKKARRKLEIENQLPRKIMMNPTTRVWLLFAILIIIGIIVNSLNSQ